MDASNHLKLGGEEVEAVGDGAHRGAGLRGDDAGLLQEGGVVEDDAGEMLADVGVLEQNEQVGGLGGQVAAVLRVVLARVGSLLQEVDNIVDARVEVGERGLAAEELVGVPGLDDARQRRVVLQPLGDERPASVAAVDELARDGGVNVCQEREKRGVAALERVRCRPARGGRPGREDGRLADAACLQGHQGQRVDDAERRVVHAEQARRGHLCRAPVRKRSCNRGSRDGPAGLGRDVRQRDLVAARNASRRPVRRVGRADV